MNVRPRIYGGSDSPFDVRYASPFARKSVKPGRAPENRWPQGGRRAVPGRRIGSTWTVQDAGLAPGFLTAPSRGARGASTTSGDVRDVDVVVGRGSVRLSALSVTPMPEPLGRSLKSDDARLVPRSAQCRSPADPRQGLEVRASSDAPTSWVMGDRASRDAPMPIKRRAALASREPPARNGSGVSRAPCDSRTARADGMGRNTHHCELTPD